jgi:hypothetical protein
MMSAQAAFACRRILPNCRFELSPYSGILTYHGPRFHGLKSVSQLSTGTGTSKLSMNLLAWPVGLDVTQLPSPLPDLLPFMTALNATHFLPRHFEDGMVGYEESIPALELWSYTRQAQASTEADVSDAQADIGAVGAGAGSAVPDASASASASAPAGRSIGLRWRHSVGRLLVRWSDDA